MAVDLLNKICTVGDRMYFISLHTKHSHCAQEKRTDVKEHSYVKL